jgi:hypothetical protein
VWEAAYGVDAWSLLAAIAARATRIRPGTMLTPLPWRRPWTRWDMPHDSPERMAQIRERLAAGPPPASAS